MGFVKLTGRIVVAVLLVYAAALLIETNFAILGDWIQGAYELRSETGGLSKQAWVTIGMIAFVAWMLWEAQN